MLLDAAHAEHTVSTRTEDETVVPSAIAELFGKYGLPAVAHASDADWPTFARCATVGNLRVGP